MVRFVLGNRQGGQIYRCRVTIHNYTVHVLLVLGCVSQIGPVNHFYDPKGLAIELQSCEN